MLDILSVRQRDLLNFLLENKRGATVDELSRRLEITRNAVRQHLAALENDGLVYKALTRPSGGRPEQLYVLTEKGHEFFPRQYSWFAQLLLESIEQEAGAAVASERLTSMGKRVGEQLRAQHPNLKTPEEKVQALSKVMGTMGYSAKVPVTDATNTVIEADNCIFHNLAFKNPDVCKFDLALLSTFTGSEVDHQECMAKGGNVCRFKFAAKDKP